MKIFSKKMKQHFAAASIAVLTSATALPASAHYTFTEVKYPTDPKFTQLLGINNDGVIAGYYGDGAMVPNHGFTLTLPNHFTPEDVNGAVQTQVIGINNVLKTGGFFVDAKGFTHGFIRNNKGPFITLDAPKTWFNQILSVNDLGESAGYSSPNMDGANGQRAFIHGAAGFTYVPLKFPGMGNSQATGINDANIVCGFYVDANKANLGFLWDKKNNTLKTLNYQNGNVKANFTQALGLNNAGQVVGVYSTDGGATTHGFVYKQGQYTSIDEPNSNNLSATLVNGINDRGQIVGFFQNKAGDTVGFVGTPKTPLWW